jgi:hypothetical protein
MVLFCSKCNTSNEARVEPAEGVIGLRYKCSTCDDLLRMTFPWFNDELIQWNYEA